MALFLEGSNLNAKLEKLIREADTFLLIVSPYIKIHSRIRQELIAKKRNSSLPITVVFGKNPHDHARSMGDDDYYFLEEFPNISIYHHEHLHAKYYCSEDAALITSMNLYEYSQNNNIEAGVMLLSPDANTKSKTFGTDVDEHAYRESLDYFRVVTQQSELIYSSEDSKMPHTGYCIRTGIPIDFNLQKPMSYEAYRTWALFENRNYPENFCHKTGKPSYGRTSMNNPILIK